MGDDDDVKDQKYCGVFMNAIYRCYKRNAGRNFVDNFSNLQDEIRDKSTRAIPIRGNENDSVGLSINESGNLSNGAKLQIVFGCFNTRNVKDYKRRIAI